MRLSFSTIPILEACCSFGVGLHVLNIPFFEHRVYGCFGTIWQKKKQQQIYRQLWKRKSMYAVWFTHPSVRKSMKRAKYIRGGYNWCIAVCSSPSIASVILSLSLLSFSFFLSSHLLLLQWPNCFYILRNGFYLW